MWILGNPITIEGSEFSNTRAIYICNHASPMDIFLVMWLTPTGTVGIAKKEVSDMHSLNCYNFITHLLLKKVLSDISGCLQTLICILKET